MHSALKTIIRSYQTYCNPKTTNPTTIGIAFRSFRTRIAQSEFSKNVTVDRNQLSHDVLNPATRTTLIGEQPNHWDQFQPGCDEPTSSAKQPRR